jgi:hypothetical protein
VEILVCGRLIKEHEVLVEEYKTELRKMKKKKKEEVKLISVEELEKLKTLKEAKEKGAIIRISY